MNRHPSKQSTSIFFFMDSASTRPSTSSGCARRDLSSGFMPMPSRKTMSGGSESAVNGLLKCPVEIIVKISSHCDDIRPIINLSSTCTHFQTMLAPRPTRKMVAKAVMGQARLKDLLYDGCWTKNTSEYLRAIKYAKYMARLDELEGCVLPVIEDVNDKQHKLVEEFVHVDEFSEDFGKIMLVADSIGRPKTPLMENLASPYFNRITGQYQCGYLTGMETFDCLFDGEKLQFKFKSFDFRDRDDLTGMRLSLQGAYDIKRSGMDGKAWIVRQYFEATDPRDKSRVMFAYPQGRQFELDNEEMGYDFLVLVHDSDGTGEICIMLEQKKGPFDLIRQFATARHIVLVYEMAGRGESPERIVEIHDLNGELLYARIRVPMVTLYDKFFVTNNHLWVIDEKNCLYSLSIDAAERGITPEWRLQVLGRCCYNLQPSQARFYSEWITLVSRGVLVLFNHATFEVRYFAIPEMCDSAENGVQLDGIYQDDGGGTWFVDAELNVCFLHRSLIKDHYFLDSQNDELGDWRYIDPSHETGTYGEQLDSDIKPFKLPPMSPYHNEFKALLSIERVQMMADTWQVLEKLKEAGNWAKMLQIVRVRRVSELRRIYYQVEKDIDEYLAYDDMLDFRYCVYEEYNDYLYKFSKDWDDGKKGIRVVKPPYADCVCMKSYTPDVGYLYRRMQYEEGSSPEEVHEYFHNQVIGNNKPPYGYTSADM